MLLCEKIARATGGVKNISPLSWGGGGQNRSSWTNRIMLAAVSGGWQGTASVDTFQYSFLKDIRRVLKNLMLYEILKFTEQWCPFGAPALVIFLKIKPA